MQKLLLVDETFDSNITFSYKLSIQLSLDGFSFCIIDEPLQKVVLLGYYELFESNIEFIIKDIEKVYKDNEILSAIFKEVTILLSFPNRKQLIPSQFFNPKSLKDLQTLCFSNDNEEPFSNHIAKQEEQVLITELHCKLSDFLFMKHPNAYAIDELELWAKYNKEKKTSAIVKCSRQFVSILIVENENKLAFNSFAWSYESDLLYYILGFIKNLGSDIDKILLHGEVNQFSYIYQQLKTYFKDVQLIDRPKEIEYSYLLNRLPDARFIDLFKSLCP